MAFQCFSSLILLLFLAFSSIISGISLPSSSPAFGFIKGLGGCKKGTKSEGIQRLRHYLREFGYLPEAQTLKSNYFDNALESAIKTYQQNFQLKPSGTLDSKTVSTMMTSRCGVPDIMDGTNYMQKPRTNLFLHTNIVSHYRLFPGGQKWEKRQLRFRFSPIFPTYAMPPVRRAFQKWSNATRQYFEFTEVRTNQVADLSIAFFRGEHRDSLPPFDGPGGIFAHAFPPPSGDFHYDGDEQWSAGPGLPSPNSTDLETVALHEIGHLLGLQHSNLPEAIMFPFIAPGTTKNIQRDDINGIQFLY